MFKQGLALIIVAIFLTLSVVSYGGGFQTEPFGPKVKYDVFDGTGDSRAKVDVIEWEGNLELHVYPKGMLAGLALKLDQRDKKKPVMVIGYRFRTQAQIQYVRRAILGVNLKEGFKVFEETSADDYTKIVISNHTLQGDVVAFNLDDQLTDLYPAGHPLSKAVAQASDKETGSSEGKRVPAQTDNQKEEEAPKAPVDDSGSLKHFNFK